MEALPTLASVLSELQALGVALPPGPVRIDAYGDSEALSRELLGLIRSGRKRAGTGLLRALEAEGAVMPQEGDIEIVLDHRNKPALITRLEQVCVVPYDRVTAEYAAIEGEGDGSLEYWREAHWAFFSRECQRIGRTPSEDMPVVCSVFRLLEVLPHGPVCRLRPASIADALCLHALATQVFLDTYATAGIRPALAREVDVLLSTSAFEARLRQPFVRITVAERDAHLVGFSETALGTRHPQVADPAAAELVRLYVQSPFLRQGIGSRLLHEAERAALAEGASTLWLTAWVGNARALAFYTSRGYGQLGSTEYVFEGESFENRLFARALLHDAAAQPTVLP